MKRRILAVLMLVAFCFCGAGELTSARAAVQVVYVAANYLPVYQQPSTGARCLGIMAYGEAMYCLAAAGSWAMVKNTSGAVGYCAKGGLSTQNPNNISCYVYINTAGTAVYRYPNLYSKVLMKLPLNACFRAVAVTQDRQWIRLQNGSHYGYVPLSRISTQKITVQTPTKADRIAILAANLIGRNYAYGAEGSAKFDCSGLTLYVYKNAAGINLYRTSAQQAADSRFKKISTLSSLKRGDLLCFSTESSSIDHVGIYIGSGKFIHASQSKGQVVASDLNTSYWKSSFRWARRIV